MSIGDKIIDEIIKQGMVKTDPQEPTVLVWSSNAEEQLSAVVLAAGFEQQAQIRQLRAKIEIMENGENLIMDTAHKVADEFKAEALASRERISWLEKQREVERQQKEAALTESEECLRQSEQLRAEVARLKQHRDTIWRSANVLHHAIADFLKDWKDGDFGLPTLARFHVLSIEEKYRELGKALLHTNKEERK